MAVWQVQKAKTRLSEVIEEANTKGRRSSRVTARSGPSFCRLRSTGR